MREKQLCALPHELDCGAWPPHLCDNSHRPQQEVEWGQSAVRCLAVGCLQQGPVLAVPSFLGGEQPAVLFSSSVLQAPTLP